MLINFIIFLLLSNELKCTNVIRQFYKNPDSKEFALNDTVTLSCELQLLKNSLIAVLRKDKTMYSEGCTVFNKNKYEMTCKEKSKDEIKYKEYIFKIKSLEWSDRGTWECLYAQNKKHVTVQIKVPPKFSSLEIDPLKPPINKLENIGPAYPIDSKSPFILKGRGSRTNPYNLRQGMALKMTCTSSCSYPSVVHLWSFANMTHGPNDIVDKIESRVNTTCSTSNNDGMFSSQSNAIINCTTLKMVGANEVVCYSNSEKTSVYVLCPGGERPWELTTGEIIGLATSVGIIILLICLLCYMVKRSRTAYHNPPDVSTNTYSSGIKV